MRVHLELGKKHGVSIRIGIGVSKTMAMRMGIIDYYFLKVL